MTARNKSENVSSEGLEARIKGLLSDNGVKISKKENIDLLSSRGYGVAEDSVLTLAFYEALYLVGKELLEVEDKKKKPVDFQGLLQRYKSVKEGAWAEYLAYRDLRSRGYVVREGFGLGMDFRVYERGVYSKDTAKYLVLSIQEGKPVSMEDLENAIKRSQSAKKELILAVMNRRGEVVYYAVSKLNLA